VHRIHSDLLPLGFQISRLVMTFYEYGCFFFFSKLIWSLWVLTFDLRNTHCY
jgi:hypothetical protein